MRIILVKNANHTILPEQKKILQDYGWTGETINIPPDGLTLQEMKNIIDKYNKPRFNKTTLAFLSPVPAMMVLASNKPYINIATFHNDQRIAMEEKRPDGTTIVKHVIPQYGWKLVF